MTETYCTAFMEDLPPEKQAEGLGVQAAVILGECFRCKDYARCSTDETFKFPADAACMVRRDMLRDCRLRIHGGDHGHTGQHERRKL